MSATSSITDTGFAPWSMMAPTNDTVSPNQKRVASFSVSELVPNNTQVSKQVASLNTNLDKPKIPTSQNPYHGAALTEPITSDSGRQPDEKSELDMGPMDFLDIINPLQHIPIVGAIYREITGDDIHTPARIAGGTLYGGPIGFVASVINSIVDEETGQDIGEHAFAVLSNDNTQTKRLTEAPVTQDTSQAHLGTKPEQALNSVAAQPLAQNIITNGNDLSKPQTVETSNKNIDPRTIQVASVSGEMAPKLAAIPKSAGGLNMTHMPGAIMNDQSGINEAVQKTIPINPAQQKEPVQFRPLSQDIQRQLDHINRLNQHNTVLNQQESLTPPAPKTEPKAEVVNQQDTDHSAKMAAYQNAQNMAQAAHNNQPVDISEAMINALEKYDALLNGN